MKPQFTPKTYFIHIGLFLISVFTTLLVGAELVTGKFWLSWGVIDAEHLLSWADLSKGIPYSFAFLAFLTFHEFGHYFTAVYHQVKSSLPFYIPVYIPIPGLLNIGSFGAVIALRSVPESTRKFFDIGIAGPLAGFVVSLLILIYGFATLPPADEYILNIHPEYTEIFGGVPDDHQMRAYILANENLQAYKVGKNLLFELLRHIVPADQSRVPGQFEMIHYPLLFVGYITLFFTALNLLPIGQLDGGHIIYGMFGRKTAGYISRMAVIVLMLFGGTGNMEIRDISVGKVFIMGMYAMFLVYILSKILGRNNWQQIGFMTLIILMIQVVIKLNIPSIQSNFIWLFYGWMVVRFIKVDHPPARHEHRVNRPRQILGWVAIVIFILCFTPSPIQVIGGEGMDVLIDSYLNAPGSSSP